MPARCKIKRLSGYVRTLYIDAKTALENTSMLARHNQTESELSDRRLPSKENSALLKKGGRQKKENKRNVSDIHVIINFVFVHLRYNYFRIEKEKR